MSVAPIGISTWSDGNVPLSNVSLLYAPGDQGSARLSSLSGGRSGPAEPLDDGALDVRREWPDGTRRLRPMDGRRRKNVRLSPGASPPCRYIEPEKDITMALTRVTLTLD